jgi:hypothetical protein
VNTGSNASVVNSNMFGGRIPSPKFCKTLVKIYVSDSTSFSSISEAL